MKKVIILSSLLVAIVVLSFTTNVAGYTGLKKVSTTQSIPENVMKVLKTSCGACHSNSGGASAKAMLNLDAWDTYSAKKRIKKASSMYRAISNGSMPPKSYIDKNPDAALNAEKKELINTWVKSLSNSK
jgi:mono/diheme cytochrome c family protein